MKLEKIVERIDTTNGYLVDILGDDGITYRAIKSHDTIVAVVVGDWKLVRAESFSTSSSGQIARAIGMTRTEMIKKGLVMTQEELEEIGIRPVKDNLIAKNS